VNSERRKEQEINYRPIQLTDVRMNVYIVLISFTDGCTQRTFRVDKHYMM
jgi:hypothetical protein